MDELFTKTESKKIINNDNQIFNILYSPKGVGKTILTNKIKSDQIIQISYSELSIKNNQHTLFDMIEDKFLNHDYIARVTKIILLKYNNTKREDNFSYLMNKVVIIEDFEFATFDLDNKDKLYSLLEFLAILKRINDYFQTLENKNKFPKIFLVTANNNDFTKNANENYQKKIKASLNDIAISDDNLQLWNIYQKNILGFAIQNRINLNLFVLFDYESTYWRLNHDQPTTIYNQNIRNLISLGNENLSLFQLFNYQNTYQILPIYNEISNDMLKITSYKNWIYEIELMCANSQWHAIILFFILKKVDILCNKFVSEFPINTIKDYWRQDWLNQKDNNLFLSFNKNALFNYIKDENCNDLINNDEIIINYQNYLFWLDEDFDEHKRFIFELNLSDKVKLDTKEDIFKLYVKIYYNSLTNEEISSNPNFSWNSEFAKEWNEKLPIIEYNSYDIMFRFLEFKILTNDPHYETWDKHNTEPLYKNYDKDGRKYFGRVVKYDRFNKIKTVNLENKDLEFKELSKYKIPDSEFYQPINTFAYYVKLWDSKTIFENSNYVIAKKPEREQNTLLLTLEVKN